MKWVVVDDDVDGLGTIEAALNLVVDGRNCATVWRNGTWHTWDRDGVGGENAHETFASTEPCPRSRASAPSMEIVERSDVPRAMKEAEAAVVRQGFHRGRSRRRSRRHD